MRWEKIFPYLDGAIRVLISSDASLHDRLDAAITSFTLLSEINFPPTIQKEYRQLMRSIDHYRNSGAPPELQSDLALAIFALFKHFMVEAWPPETPLENV